MFIDACQADFLPANVTRPILTHYPDERQKIKCPKRRIRYVFFFFIGTLSLKK